MHPKIADKNFVSHAYFAVGIVLIILATTVIVIAKFPQIWYTLEIHTTESELNILTEPIETDFKSYTPQDKPPDQHTLPPLDISLPRENKVIIPKIGVDAKIHEGENYDELLEKGVWRVNDFATPEDGGLIILAAHRFGYTTWSDEQRKTNSFFNLPSTRVGDTIQIIWNQRKYEYRITKVEESTNITDYEKDLILYTCKLYNSPIRIFRYAERTN